MNITNINYFQHDEEYLVVISYLQALNNRSIKFGHKVNACHVDLANQIHIHIDQK